MDEGVVHVVPFDGSGPVRPPAEGHRPDSGGSTRDIRRRTRWRGRPEEDPGQDVGGEVHAEEDAVEARQDDVCREAGDQPAACRPATAAATATASSSSRWRRRWPRAPTGSCSPGRASTGSLTTGRARWTIALRSSWRFHATIMRDERPEAACRELAVPAPDDEADQRTRGCRRRSRLGGLLPRRAGRDFSPGLARVMSVAATISRCVEVDDGLELLPHDESRGP